MAQPVNERGVVRRHSGRLTAPLLTTMATAAVAELYLRCIHIRLPTRNLAYAGEASINTSQNIFILEPFPLVCHILSPYEKLQWGLHYRATNWAHYHAHARGSYLICLHFRFRHAPRLVPCHKKLPSRFPLNLQISSPSYR